MAAQQKVKEFAHGRGHKLAPFILAWEMSKGFVVIPATLNPTHLAENLECVKIHLDKETIESFEKLLSSLKFEGERYPDMAHSNIYPEGFDVAAYKQQLKSTSALQRLHLHSTSAASTPERKEVEKNQRSENTPLATSPKH
jgi:hypothetical protein